MMPSATLILDALDNALELTKTAVTKIDAAKAVNVYVERANTVKTLQDCVPVTGQASTEQQKADAVTSYQSLYQDIQRILAGKKITPNVYAKGDVTITVPLASLVQLMDAAS